MTKAKLQVRKQQLVKDAIYDSAIELFAAQGFDETTVEEIAQAAGISRRSFFRYYATKDDLLAQSVLSYGVALTDSIAASSANLTLLELLQETVTSGIRHTAANPVTRQVIEIAQRSGSARRAYASRLADVEDSLSAAYAVRFAGSTKNGLKPRLMAHLTHSLLSASIVAWFTGECQDLSTSSRQAFNCLAILTREPESSTPIENMAKAGRRLLRPTISRNSTK